MRPNPGGHLIIYDGACPMCTFQMRVLTWLDWCHIATFLPISSEAARRAAPGLREEDLRLAIHCLAPDGRIYRGARCIRRLAMRMPLLWPLGLLLWVPGVIQLAELVYGAVARNRYLLSRMFRCKEACRVLPARPGRMAGAQPTRPEPAATLRGKDG